MAQGILSHGGSLHGKSSSHLLTGRGQSKIPQGRCDKGSPGPQDGMDVDEGRFVCAIALNDGWHHPLPNASKPMLQSVLNHPSGAEVADG